jgi:hypothetical protein
MVSIKYSIGNCVTIKTYQNYIIGVTLSKGTTDNALCEMNNIIMYYSITIFWIVTTIENNYAK